MYRKAMNFLLEWKQKTKKNALLVTGARQIGKTYLINEFGRKYYKDYVYLNFLEEDELFFIFQDSLKADKIILRLQTFLGRTLTPGKTLIFFDEIQECPRARTAIKFLVIDGRFDYIESGSLLGVEYKEVPSLPVGYEDRFRMYPMDFEEFCMAMGVLDSTLEQAKEAFSNRIAVDTVVHNVLMENFRFYMIVGGMPAAVQEFSNRRNLKEVLYVQNQIIDLYRGDVKKYSQTDKNKITAIFNNIPNELDAHNKRFTLKNVNEHAKMREYEDAFIWLQDAGVALPCFNLKEPKAPLRLNEQSRLFKLFLNDCGLLCAMSFQGTQFNILSGNLKANLGSFFENIVAQSLVANGLELRYLDKRGVGELDFVVQRGAQVIPIEVKSSHDYRKHFALNNVMKVKDWNFEEAFVLCEGNIEKNGKITYLPWYMVSQIKQMTPEEMFKDIKVTI
ncbi:MAG: AAA family ATPase [Succinivibrio sp.]|nr:AAA family ATPase [Succinivibrio sp.]